VIHPHCLICGENPVAPLIGAQCPNCGGLFSSFERGIAQSMEAPSSIAYPEDGNENTFDIEDSSFWFKHRNKVILSLLKHYPAEGPLIDVGGGNGYQAVQIQKLHHLTVMVEPGIHGCLRATQRGVRRIVRSTLEALHLRSETLGALCFFDVLEHLETPCTILEEANRVLSNHGRIFITVPALPMLWSDEDIYASHQRRYTVVSLRNELRKVGFQPEYLTYFFSPLLVPVFLFRCLPYRLGLRKRETMEKKDHHSTGVFSQILEWGLNKELVLIQKKKKLLFGSSLLCVASKIGRE